MTSEDLEKAKRLLNDSNVMLSTITPSQWAEKNLIMRGAMPGRLNLDATTPYAREILDSFSPFEPYTDIVFMGGAQICKTSVIILGLIGYMIENYPCNTAMTVGYKDLMKEAMGNIDQMLADSNLKRLIRSNSSRKRKTLSGDTDQIKEFPNGYLKLSPASEARIWRQNNYKLTICDDIEAAKGISKSAGSIVDLVGKRTATYGDSAKRAWISSPELESNSIIYNLYKQGDGRLYHIECPCCGEMIDLLWNHTNEEGEECGIVWKVDSADRLIEKSVMYICQKCGNSFKENLKPELMKYGKWIPTLTPISPKFRSYQMNSFYSPIGMASWTSYVYTWLSIHADGQRDESRYQTFRNTTEGLPYKPNLEELDSKELQKNQCKYEPFTVPETLSIKHGNGSIIMLTLACDLAGRDDDARLDWEIVAWCENESSYSIAHGSIGTFERGGHKINNRPDREVKSYGVADVNNVWKPLLKLINGKYKSDNGKEFGITCTVIDSGFFTQHVYSFIKSTGRDNIYAVKGKGKGNYSRYSAVFPIAKGSEFNSLYTIVIGNIKDRIASYMTLKYDETGHGVQQPNFMNYPESVNGMYSYKDFFIQYESEERVAVNEGKSIDNYIWQKKYGRNDNHFWDVRVYGIAAKLIYTMLVCKELKVENDWKVLVNVIKN